jgi:hypothetical protein
MADETEGLVKVVVELNDPDGKTGSERVWALPVGDDVYEIRNSPWYARNINWGDWVKAIAPDQDSWPVFEAVVKRSGHRTIQLSISPDGVQRRDEILAGVKKMGASYENNDDAFYAWDCSPEVSVIPITTYLDQLKAHGLVEYLLCEH